MSSFPEELIESLLEPGQNPSLQYKTKVHEKTLLLDEKPVDFKEVKRLKEERRERKQLRRRLGRDAKKDLYKKIPKEMKCWKECVPLHEMWKEYVADLFELDHQNKELASTSASTSNLPNIEMNNTSNMNEKLARCDFHGALLTVIKSKTPSNIGKCGIVVKETENMFYMIGRESELIIMKKKNQVFGLQVSPTHYAQLFGNNFCIKTEMYYTSNQRPDDCDLEDMADHHAQSMEDSENELLSMDAAAEGNNISSISGMVQESGSFKSKIINSISNVFKEENQRMALNSIFFSSSISILFISSFLFYLIFYYLTMPNVQQSIDCYFDYSNTPFPQALIDFKQVNYLHETIVFKSGQKYNLGLELVVPDSETNFNQGNFMITLELLGASNNTLVSVSKPMHLHYKSPLLRTLGTLLFSPFLLLGSSKEISTASVSLILNYLEKGSSTNAIKFARVTLGNAMVQTYSASLLIETHFQGLAYFMHKWWLSTAVVSILNIMLVEIVLVSLVWTLLTAEDGDDLQNGVDDKIYIDESDRLQQSPELRGDIDQDNDFAFNDRESVVAVDDLEARLEPSKLDSSQRDNDDNDTLDGDSVTERSFYHATSTTGLPDQEPIIEPQVLTGMLKSRHQLAQSGNFSYPYSRSSSFSRVADTKGVPPAVVELSRSMSPSFSSSSAHVASTESDSHSVTTTSTSTASAPTIRSSVVDDQEEEAVVPLSNSLVIMDTTMNPDDLDFSNSTIHHQFGEDTTISVVDQNGNEGMDEFDMSGLLEKEDDLLL